MRCDSIEQRKKKSEVTKQSKEGRRRVKNSSLGGGPPRGGGKRGAGRQRLEIDSVRHGFADHYLQGLWGRPFHQREEGRKSLKKNLKKSGAVAKHTEIFSTKNQQTTCLRKKGIICAAA